MLVQALLALSVALGSGNLAQEGAAKDDLKKGQGSWRFVSIEIDGKDATNAFREAKVTVKGDRVSIVRPKGQDLVWTLKLDGTTNPKCIDFKNSQGETTEGIYELKADDLKVCVSIKGVKERPGEFKTAPDTGRILWVLKRDKP